MLQMSNRLSLFLGEYLGLLHGRVLAVPHSRVMVALFGDHRGSNDRRNVEVGPLSDDLVHILHLQVGIASGLHFFLGRSASHVDQRLSLVAVVVGLNNEPLVVGQLLSPHNVVHLLLDDDTFILFHTSYDEVDSGRDVLSFESRHCICIVGLLSQHPADQPGGGDVVVLEQVDQYLRQLACISCIGLDAETAVSHTSVHESAPDVVVSCKNGLISSHVLHLSSQLAKYLPELEVHVTSVEDFPFRAAGDDASAGLELGELIEEVCEKYLIEGEAGQLRDGSDLSHKVLVLVGLGELLKAVKEGLGEWDEVQKLEELDEVLLVVRNDGRPSGLGIVVDLHLPDEGRMGAVERLSSGDHSTSNSKDQGKEDEGCFGHPVEIYDYKQIHSINQWLIAIDTTQLERQQTILIFVQVNCLKLEQSDSNHTSKEKNMFGDFTTEFGTEEVKAESSPVSQPSSESSSNNLNDASFIGGVEEAEENKENHDYTIIMEAGAMPDGPSEAESTKNSSKKPKSVAKRQQTALQARIDWPRADINVFGIWIQAMYRPLHSLSGYQTIVIPFYDTKFSLFGGRVINYYSQTDYRKKVEAKIEKFAPGANYHTPVLTEEGPFSSLCFIKVSEGTEPHNFEYAIKGFFKNLRSKTPKKLYETVVIAYSRVLGPIGNIVQAIAKEVDNQVVKQILLVTESMDELEKAEEEFLSLEDDLINKRMYVI